MQKVPGAKKRALDGESRGTVSALSLWGRALEKVPFMLRPQIGGVFGLQRMRGECSRQRRNLVSLKNYWKYRV